MTVPSFLLGILLVCGTWSSVLRTVLVPRRQSTRLTRATVRLTATVCGWLGGKLRGQARERVLGMSGPLSIMFALCCWQVGMLLGVALITPLADGTGFRPGWPVDVLLLAGGHDADLLALFGWMSALAVLVLFGVHVARISAAYSRRELVITGMAMRTGRPPDAELLLAEHLRRSSRYHLDELFAQWAVWLADIRATHTAYPTLPYHRPATELCWLDAVVVVLDAAALTDAVAPKWAPPSVRTVLLTGAAYLPLLARQLGIELSQPSVSLHGREECNFEQTVRVAVAAGLPHERGYTDAWEAFQRWRTQYAPYAVAITVRLRYHQEENGAARWIEPLSDLPARGRQ